MKNLRFIIGIVFGLVLGGAFGLFVANPLLTFLFIFLGLIRGASTPPWVGTLNAFVIFLSINMGIYAGIKWAKKSKNNKD
ncbi:MAG: hypothetical protein AMK70_10655 [Nitrospira bacterium SG8_35_1]|nr:MAG: hypothetical protein AMK70_10655 [Nitrospira bacterium SG8_35_1]